MIGRLRTIASLVAPSVRVVPWSHVLGGGLLAGGLVAVAHGNRWIDVTGMVHVLRVAALVLGVSVAFVFDDPTEPLIASSPVGLRTQRLVRFVLVAPAFLALWAGLLWHAAQTPALQQLGGAQSDQGRLPLQAMSLEAGTIALATTAAASLAMSLTAARVGGLAAAPAVLLMAVLAAALPPPAGWWLWAPYPSSPGVVPAESPEWSIWIAAHQRWAVLAGLCLFVTVVAARDRGQPNRLQRAARRFTPRPTPAGG